MKKIIYFLLGTLYLWCFSFNTAAQDKNAPGAELYRVFSIKNTVNTLNMFEGGGAKANYLTTVETPLNQAASNNDVAKVKALLEAGANPNEIVDADIKITALHTAIRHGSPEMIELFIEHKADVNFRTKSGMNSLHIAALWNTDGKITALLLAAGADPNALNEDSRTPLDVAVIRSHQDVVDVLAKAMKPGTRNEGLELFEAVKTKNRERALELIKKGANLDFQTGWDTTLTEAIRQGDTEMAKALLAAGANPNEIDSKRGASALRMAVQMSNTELVELLISKYKADVNPKSEIGYSILHVAADFNASKEITGFLLAAGSDPNVIDKNGQAPYEYALARQKPEIAKLLAMVTNTEKVASLKKARGAQPPPKQTVQTPQAVAADDSNKTPEEEMDEIAGDLIRAYKQNGLKVFGEGFTDAVGRNSNVASVTSKAVFSRTTHTFVMISKNAVALNAKMNSTLLQVPCGDCNTSISNYATSTGSETINGYRIVTLNLVLINFQNNFIDLIFKSNSAGERVKWVYLSKDLPK